MNGERNPEDSLPLEGVGVVSQNTAHYERTHKALDNINIEYYNINNKTVALYTGMLATVLETPKTMPA